MTPETLYELLSDSFPTCWYDWSEIAEKDRPKQPPYCAILELRPHQLCAEDKV